MFIWLARGGDAKDRGEDIAAEPKSNGAYVSGLGGDANDKLTLTCDVVLSLMRIPTAHDLGQARRDVGPTSY